MQNDNLDYRFDPKATGGATVFLDENGEKVAFLDEPVFLPVGAQVSLPNGSESEVTNVRLDLSNMSNLAMVYISVKTPGLTRVKGQVRSM